ncbi:MAG: hypothetical protein CVV44_20190 [Spirochaetae bacterium HGW-Spirochaetae-1]|jgi:hypothetical protein|nr:MAG: hypothetical protein CVV44_20190 [Spirochaetae bacterium HGW-Spirochaetae-1]
MLDKEYSYFNEHRKEFVEKYKGKFIVIKDNDVLGVYDTIQDALTITTQKYPVGSFLVQECVPEEKTIQHFHTRVAV